MKEDIRKTCGSCKHWDCEYLCRCMNRDSVFYGDVMGLDEKCDEWEEDESRKGSGV